MPLRAKCRPETSDTAREFGIAGKWDSLRLHVLRELIKVDGAKTATKLNIRSTVKVQRSSQRSRGEELV